MSDRPYGLVTNIGEGGSFTLEQVWTGWDQFEVTAGRTALQEIFSDSKTVK